MPVRLHYVMVCAGEITTLAGKITHSHASKITNHVQERLQVHVMVRLHHAQVRLHHVQVR